jgi:hypothetical protein
VSEADVRLKMGLMVSASTTSSMVPECNWLVNARDVAASRVRFATAGHCRLTPDPAFPELTTKPECHRLASGSLSLCVLKRGEAQARGSSPRARRPAP